MCFYNGGSSGLRGILARFLSRRVRFPRLPPILYRDTKARLNGTDCKPVDSWVRIPLPIPSFYLSKALSGCVHGLGPCGPGSNPGRETNFRIATANIKNLFLKKSQKMLSCFICPFSIMVLHLFCNQVTAVRFCHGAPSLGCEQQIQKFNF